MIHLKRGPCLRWKVRLMILGGLCQLFSANMWSLAMEEPPRSVEQEHAITIDATSIVSQSWWQVPGVTPSIWASDIETSDAYRTSEPRALQLKAGQYKFVSFTFDFPFEVTPEGAVEYASSLNQCVAGRGTPTLIVRCKRTYPHGGQPEYPLAP